MMISNGAISVTHTFWSPETIQFSTTGLLRACLHPKSGEGGNHEYSNLSTHVRDHYLELVEKFTNLGSTISSNLSIDPHMMHQVK